VFLPPAAQQQAALPQAEGLPEPSIIVGFVEGVTEASFDTLEEDAGGDVAGTEIAYDNLEARRSLRDESPDLFETLVAGGAFDPPEALLETALQTELARMGCYTAGIDGVWGGGSRASVERYFTEVDGVTAETLEPTVGLFRQIIRQDEIECPEPVVVQSTTRSTSSGSSTARSTTTSRSSGSTSRSSSSSSSSSSSGGSSSGGSSGGSGGLGSTNLGGVFR